MPPAAGLSKVDRFFQYDIDSAASEMPAFSASARRARSHAAHADVLCRNADRFIFESKRRVDHAEVVRCQWAIRRLTTPRKKILIQRRP